MVQTTNILPNLLDLARRSDPDGAISVIAETLSQCNQIITDMIWHEANLPTGHKVTLRTSLPQGTWRGLNQGVASTKSNTMQVQFPIGELVDYAYVDKDLADLNGNTEKWRLSEDMAHIEGLSQQMSTAVFYSNQLASQIGVTLPVGLAAIYNTTTGSAAIVKNTLTGGGAASANASIWIAGWGDRTLYGIHPKGMPTGLQYKNLGDVVPQYDSNSLRFEAYTSMFKWWMGITVEDWRYTVRIANLDTTTNAGGLFSTTPPDLNLLMIRAAKRLPEYTLRFNGITETDAPDEVQAGINPAIYMNRPVGEAFEIQAIRNKNVLLKMEEYAGMTIPTWRGVPIRNVDALLSTESAI